MTRPILKREEVSSSAFRIPSLKNAAPHSGRAGRIIQRAQKPLFVREQFHDLFLIPQMIAAGDDIHAGGKDFFSRFGRDAGAARGVLSVGDNEIQAMLVAQLGQEFRDRAPARLPHDVADEEQFHPATVWKNPRAVEQRGNG